MHCHFCFLTNKGYVTLELGFRQFIEIIKFSNQAIHAIVTQMFNRKELLCSIKLSIS